MTSRGELTGESMSYPFVPRSNSSLRPGQFWGLRLSDGRYACGRVLAVPRKDSESLAPRVIFLGGLQDWVGADLPTSDSIAGTSVLEQGFVHVKAIQEHGGAIQGHRPLELDGIRPFAAAPRVPPGWEEWSEMQRAQYSRFSATLLTGYDFSSLPERERWQRMTGIGLWGYGVLEVLAEAQFVKRAR